MSEQTVTVKANQATTDWQDGAVFEVERTEYVDKLLANGILSEVKGVIGDFIGTFVAPMTDDDAKAAGFDLDNPYSLPAASARVELSDAHTEAADTIAEINNELDEDEPTPAPRRTRAKKTDDVGE